MLSASDYHSTHTSQFIVSSMCHREDTQLIAIERYTGKLVYTGQPGIDLFANPRDALESISRGQKFFKSVRFHRTFL